MIGTGTDAFTLDDDDFKAFQELFYRRTGIRYADSKRYFVDKRIGACIQASGNQDFRSWLATVKAGRDRTTFQALIDQMTVNETYFMREDHQFDALVEHVLPEVVAQRTGGAIRILSLPCSTGEEPYSIALTLLERWPMLSSVDVEIHAADIDSTALRAAQEGVYEARSVRRLPAGVRSRWFDAETGDRWRLKQEVRAAVDFRLANLTDTVDMRRYRGFDVIFCRNLLIYFDDVSRRMAADRLFGALRPGGILFLGHSESMGRISPIFEPRRLPQGLVYQRPAGGAQ